MKKLWDAIEKNRLYRKVCENRILGKFMNRETISYIIAGTMTTLLGFAFFGLFIWLSEKNGWLSGTSPALTRMLAEHPWLKYVPNLTDSLRAFAAEAFSAVFALAFSFAANKHFVFKSKSWKFKIASHELAKFLSARLLSLFIETTIVVLFVSVLNLDIIFAKIVGTVLVIILNYILSKTVIFKKSGVLSV